MSQPSAFSVWMRKHLKAATEGLITQDIDYIVFLERKKFFLIEEKTRESAKVSPPQAVIAKMLSDIFGLVSKDFLGYFLVYALEGGTPYVPVGNNKIRFNQLIDLLKKEQEIHYRNWFEEVIKKYFNILWDCQGEPGRKKTESERTFVRPANLRSVLESLSLEYTTVDWIFVNYCTGNFILIQESQISERLREIDILLSKYNSCGQSVANPKSKAEYKYLGLYQLEFNPSRNVYKLNGKSLQENELINLLNLDSEDIKNYL